MARVWCLGPWVLLVGLPACLRELSFTCDDDTACVIDDRQGQCVPTGHCAYPDDACPSQLRYGPAAGPALAHACVGAGAADGSSSGDGCGACETPPGPCHEPEGSCAAGACSYPPSAMGTPCTLDDPCVTQARCDGAGACAVAQEVSCTTPPGPCHVTQGTCGADGSCTYALREPEAPCEDGNGCTLGDACDGAGTCEPGPICPTDNPCAAGSCDGRQCSFFPVADGSACGPLPQDTCCAGACVDISVDGANCGGCGIDCAPMRTCVPRGTSGVCTPA